MTSVRAGSFVISTVRGLQENELRDHPECIPDLRRQDVKRVTPEGNSYTILGMGIGFAAGVVPGLAIGKGSADEPEAGFAGT